jgi:hypothetical protein
MFFFPIGSTALVGPGRFLVSKHNVYETQILGEA